TSGFRPERLAQNDQVVAQVLFRLALGALGPQGSSQPGATDGAALTQCKKRQQPFDRTGTHAWKRLAANENPQRPEQANGQRSARARGFLRHGELKLVLD